LRAKLFTHSSLIRHVVGSLRRYGAKQDNVMRLSVSRSRSPIVEDEGRHAPSEMNKKEKKRDGAMSLHAQRGRSLRAYIKRIL